MSYNQHNKKYKYPARTSTGSKNKPYTVWNDMMRRCTNEKVQEKQPTYRGCTVCDEWHDYDVFYEWFQEHYRDGYKLDKDILFQGNKVYSPDTCVFVPNYINCLFTMTNAKRGQYPVGVYFRKDKNKFIAQLSFGGVQKNLGSFDDPIEAFKVYEEAKYKRVKDIAENALKIGEIDQRTHDAMLRYVIEMY